MRTVVEYSEFNRKAIKEFGEEGKDEIVTFLSDNPKSGKRIDDFGGIRKLEWMKRGLRDTEHCIYFLSRLKKSSSCYYFNV